MSKLSSFRIALIYLIVRLVLIVDVFYNTPFANNSFLALIILVVFAIILFGNIRKELNNKQILKKSFIQLGIMVLVFIVGNIVENKIIEGQSKVHFSYSDDLNDGAKEKINKTFNNTEAK